MPQYENTGASFGAPRPPSAIPAQRELRPENRDIGITNSPLKKWGRHLACRIRWTENSISPKNGRLEACPTTVFVNSIQFFNGLLRTLPE